jgi:hypothetical protein
MVTVHLQHKDALALRASQQPRYNSALQKVLRPRPKRLGRAVPTFSPPEALNQSGFASAKSAPPPGAQKYSAIASARTFR